MSLTENPIGIRIELIQLGVSQLKNLGYWWANATNIFSDSLLWSYFQITLREQLGDYERDEVINELLNQ